MTQTISFFVCFFGVALWESFRPRTAHSVSARLRWTANISLGVINLLVFGVLLPDSIFTRPEWVPSIVRNTWQAIDKVPLLAFGLAFLLLDLFDYWMHRVFHAVPVLWRLHMIHHADPEIDASTAMRHHPLEFLAGSLFRMLPAVALGVPAAIIFVYLLVAGGIVCFHHGNIGLPKSIAALAGAIFVTPDVHRIHHSVVIDEGNSNFGAVFSFWDRVFGTYVSKSPAEQERIEFGLREYSDPRYCEVLRVMGMPFSSRRPRTATSFNVQ